MNNTEQKVIPLHRLKVITIVITIIALLIGNSNFGFNIFLTVTILNIKLLSWLIAFIFVLLIAIALHHIVYKITINELEFSSNKKVPLFKTLKDPILFIISSDYLFAKYYKRKLSKDVEESCPNRQGFSVQHFYNDKKLCTLHLCEDHMKKKSRKLFILLSNWSNVIFVCILIISTLFIEQGLKGNTFKEIYFAFLLLHSLSRGIEIVVAFYKDVVIPRMNSDLDIDPEEKLSYLKRGNRISLAVHSYLEITLLYGIIYFMEPGIINGIKEDSLLDYILYSFSVIGFNFSFSNEFTTLGKVLHASQVLIGITLIVISIANYLGLKDKMTDLEKSDWKNKKYI